MAMAVSNSSMCCIFSASPAGKARPTLFLSGASACKSAAASLPQTLRVSDAERS